MKEAQLNQLQAQTPQPNPAKARLPTLFHSSNTAASSGLVRPPTCTRADQRGDREQMGGMPILRIRLATQGRARGLSMKVCGAGPPATVCAHHAQHIVGLRNQLHVAVLDAVVHHLHVVACGSGVVGWAAGGGWVTGQVGVGWVAAAGVHMLRPSSSAARCLPKHGEAGECSSSDRVHAAAALLSIPKLQLHAEKAQAACSEKAQAAHPSRPCRCRSRTRRRRSGPPPSPQSAAGACRPRGRRPASWRGLRARRGGGGSNVRGAGMAAGRNGDVRRHQRS